MKTKILSLLAAVLIFTGVQAQIPTDGLVLNLSLDGVAVDSSSYKNACENHGATPIADRTGKPGKAMAFDGYSYIRIPSTKALDLTSNRTMSCWAYIPSNMIPYMYPTLIYKQEPLKYSATYCIQLCGCSCYNENQYKFTSLSTSGLTHYQAFTKQLYTDYYNRWTHIVTTYDTISGYMKMYLNGRISDSTYWGKVVFNTSNLDLTIGCGGISSDYRTFFNGYIDDVLLYNRALSAGEISGLYNEKLFVNAGSDKAAVCGGSVKLDSVTTNYTGGGKLKYKWTPATGLNVDTIANPICTSASDITYTVTVTTPDSLIATDNVSISQKSFSPLNTSTIYKYLTCGEVAKFDTILTNYSGSGRLKYKWSPATGLSSDTVARPTCTIGQSTYYTVKITTPTGCSAYAYVSAYVYSNYSYYSNYKTISCGDTLKMEAVTTDIQNKTNLHYKWTPNIGLNSDTIATPIAKLSGDQVYSYVVTNSLGCTVSYGKVYVTYSKKTKPSINIVGVDANNKNRIYWDKSIYSGVNKFNIYKETNITDSYAKIGSVSYDSASMFVDTLSFPNVQSNRYKLSILDKCGFETDLSDYHRTMHLSINKGVGASWNLIWESYEGYAVSTYNIYRGTSASNIVQIGTLSGNNNQFSDFSAPTGDVYYQIEAIKVGSSEIKSENKAKAPEASASFSRSNIATNANASSGINGLKEISDVISICPNPASANFDLFVGNEVSAETNYTIYNMMGAVVQSEKIVANKQRIVLDNLSNGVYLLVVRSEKMIGSKKLIIQR
jgi:hypothetical protein